MYLLRALLIVCLAAMAHLGCGPEESPPASLGDDQGGNFGDVLLSLEQQVDDQSEDGPSEELRISARFVKVRDADRAYLRDLLGGELPASDGAIGGCEQVRPTSSRPSSEVLSSSLELLDAGDLTLRAGDEELRIPDWNFPSIYGVAPGVLYGNDEDLGLTVHPGQEYRVVGAGSSEIGPFEVLLTAPAGWYGLTVASVDDLEESPQIEPGSPLEIRWEPGQQDDQVLFELAWTQFAVEQRAACLARDDGTFEIPEQTVAQLAEPGVTDARLAAYRYQRTAFRAEGLDEGEALFLVSANVPLRVP